MAAKGLARALWGPAAWTALLLLVAGGKAHGGVETDEFRVQPGGRLVVDAPRGSVRVNTVPVREGESVRVTVDVHRFGLPPLTRIHSYQEDDLVVVEGRNFPLLHWLPPWSWQRVRIDVTVPEEFDIDITTRGGAIEVTGVTGEVEARTWGGRLRFRDITGSISGRTAGGRIEVDDCAGDVDVRTAGGPINLDRVGGNVIARTHGGGIQLYDIGGDIEVRTSGGSIEAVDVGGELIAHTSGGGIRARFEGAPAGELETSGGSIDVAFPADVGAELDARSFGGRVEVDHDSITSGGHLLRLRTSGGSIRVHEL